MGKDSKIEWTHHTFNPWRGCSKVSPGCAHCYAEVTAPSRVARGRGIETWGANASRVMASEQQWDQVIGWERLAMEHGERYRVFCASLADVFEDYQGGDVRDAAGCQIYESLAWLRYKLFDLIRRTPRLDWLLLTKRPENFHLVLNEVGYMLDGLDGDETGMWINDWFEGNAPHNVWMGTTVENQDMADKRIPELLKIPAAVRFLSCEPMVGQVDLDAWCGWAEPQDGGRYYMDGIDWVICGGESGPKARQMHPDWARILRDQCKWASVPFLFKQWGEWLPSSQKESLTVSASDFAWPVTVGHPDNISYKVGKKAAGRLLDGVEHNGFPEVKS